MSCACICVGVYVRAARVGGGHNVPNPKDVAPDADSGFPRCRLERARVRVRVHVCMV